MTNDTEIRHVTKAGANLFLELGFSAAEVARVRGRPRGRPIQFQSTGLTFAD
jgi:hypothetical protein